MTVIPRSRLIGAMCNLYSTKGVREEMGDLFRAAAPDADWGAHIYPDQDAPVIRRDEDGGRRCDLLRWGFPPPPKGRAPVTGARNLSSPYWRPWLKRSQRCLVPFTAFAENDAQRRPHWFHAPERSVAAFAGLWRPWTGERLVKKDGFARRVRERRDWRLFAFLTTTPNAVVAPIHEKAMPVILTEPDEWDLWLEGEDGPLVSALARPLPADRLALLGS